MDGELSRIASVLFSRSRAHSLILYAMRASSLVHDIFGTFALRVLVYVAAFLITVIVARSLGPEGRALYYLPFVAASTAVIIAKLGVEQSNLYLFGTRRIPAHVLAGQSALVAWVPGLALVPLLVIGAHLVPAVFGDVPLVLVALAALTIPLTLHTQLAAGLLNLVGQVTWPFAAAVIATLAQLALILALHVTGHLDVTTATATTLGATAATWLLTLLARPLRGAPRFAWRADLLRETFRVSLPIHVGMVLLFLHLRADTFLVKAFSGTFELGIYSLSVVLAESLFLLTDSLDIALVSRQMNVSVRDAARRALRAARLTVLVGLLAGGTLLLAGPAVIPFVFGPEFEASYLPLALLLPGVVFMGMQRVYGNALLRAGPSWRFAWIHGGSLAVNVVANIVLLPALGATGAAIASTVSYALSAYLFLMWTARIAGRPILVGVVPTTEDVRFLVATARDIIGRRVLHHTQDHA